MGRGGGRDRYRRDYPSRFDERSNSGRNSSNNPPSRHLWVGNLAHNITENELTRHFLQFGPLESVAFQPGRSYTFINFKRDEDGIDALKALQDFPVAGNPLRIEFAKAVSHAHLFLSDTFPDFFLCIYVHSPAVQFNLLTKAAIMTNLNKQDFEQ